LGEEVLIQDGEMYLNALDYDGNGLVNLTSLLGCFHENKTMTNSMDTFDWISYTSEYFLVQKL